jgi:hypothetical protein
MKKTKEIGRINKLSLCYDFQKWTILSLTLVAISLTVGLLLQLHYAHGIVNGQSTMYGASAYRQSKVILRYCYEHADRPNPVQDLIDKAILTPGYFEGETCPTVKQFHDTFPASYAKELIPYCRDGAKERGVESSQLELGIKNCVEDVLKLEGIP